MSSAYFPEDKREKENLRKYTECKMELLWSVVLFTIFYDCFIKENNSPTLFVTLMYSLF